MIGALTQAPRHSTSNRVNFLSGVVSPMPMPSFFLQVATIASDPRSQHGVVVLILREIKQPQHRAGLASGRIFGDVSLRLLEILRREGKARRLLESHRLALRAHRSISPKTMSIEPMIATTSASMCPRDMKSRPCRKAKPGARILQRYGRLPPSATR